MKKLISLFVVMAAMVMALSACGSDSAADNQAAEPIDLAALNTQIISDCGIGDYVEIAAEALPNLYGIDVAGVAESVGFSAPSDSAFPQEVIVVLANDDAAAADIQQKFENRLANIEEQASSYDPGSAELAQKCSVVTDGLYVALFFSAQYDTMVADFQAAMS